jgi:hypothetical protein
LLREPYFRKIGQKYSLWVKKAKTYKNIIPIAVIRVRFGVFGGKVSLLISAAVFGFGLKSIYNRVYIL